MKKKITKFINKIASENFKFWEVVILMVLTVIVGISVGGFVIKKNYGFKTLSKLSYPLQEFINNYNYITDNYYGDLDETKLLNKALESLLKEIDDPYADYFEPQESSNFDIQLSGSYQGIGVEVSTLIDTQELIITNVFEDTPAYKSGLKIGDIIVKINDEKLNGVNSVDFVNKIKSLENEFKLTIMRENKEYNFDVKNDTIILKSVQSDIINEKIGYVSISIFANNTYKQLKQSLEQLNNLKVDSLIIDLRGNTGGYLSSVENILGLFLDSTHVIYQVVDKNGTKKIYSSGKITVNYPIVVLTNSSTASAAEIMTGTLKEELGAVSIGKKTYGKGSAQKLHTNSDGSKYKFTTQKWLTPSGSSIDGVGIDVDYEVEMNEKYYKNPNISNDTQLQYAIDLLNK